MSVDELICTPRSLNSPAFVLANISTLRRISPIDLLPFAAMTKATYVRRVGLLIVALLIAPILRAADVQNKVDWPKFLSRHDLIFNRPPEKWGEGAFTGNGLLGAMVYLTDDK